MKRKIIVTVTDNRWCTASSTRFEKEKSDSVRKQLQGKKVLSILQVEKLFWLPWKICCNSKANEYHVAALFIMSCDKHAT